MNKKATQIISLMAVCGCFAIAVSSCGKKDANSPGVEFMPDMYRSPSLETNMGYVDMNTGDTLEANRMPVQGTVARGYLPYAYENNAAGYESAGINLRNPLTSNEANLAEGQELYGKFCVHCHGAGGEGDGLVGKKLPGPPPAYSTLKNLSVGKMFHTITYGKGLMGPHAPLLSQEERWKVILYIEKLMFPDGRTTAATDTAKTSAPAAVPGEASQATTK
jgi:mono/diheme cytochrome c family protein